MLRRHIISLLLAAASSLTPSWAQGPGSSGTYYRQADGKSGAQLKTALCGIIYNRTERTYNELWTDFRTTDARPNGKVWDMYSAISNFTFGTDQAGNYRGEGDVYNREHSFPKSWFGGQVKPMYTDLNHLYPTDGYVNNRRSNYPFGTTNGETYMSANNFSKLGACTYPGYSGKVFEPADEYKGDFARTYFYMVTCYEEKLPTWYSNYSESRATLDGRTYPGLSQWQLQMLLSWAAQDPVSSKETQRNEAVWSIQHNRNPFIDYPGLEQYIWGDKKGIPFRYDGSHDNGIFTVTAEPQPSHPDGAVYDLQGRAINESASPTKGIYIRGGRKFVVR
ncbi:MAG: endonuclease [Prevotella sp.]|nr:endonuclease [Prevotella sp.]